MGKKHSIADARTNLPRLVREVESGKTVELTRRGELVAVLIGQKEYERLTARPRRFSEAWSDFAREVNLQDFDIDPAAVFEGVRDPSPGRDSDL